MKAIILAAGENKEIAPYIEDTPKCMLGLDGETILGREIRLLENVGFSEDDIIVVIGYNKEKVALPQNIKRVDNCEYNNYGNSFSLLLGLKTVLKTSQTEDVVVLDGDLVFDEDIIYDVVNAKGNIIVEKEKTVSFGKTGILVQNERVISIGKHIDGEKTYENIFRIKSSSIKRYMDLLEESKSFWYTVALDRLVKEEEFKEQKVFGYLEEINSFQDYQEVLKDRGIKNDTILLTGASGFLGRKIFSLLKRRYSIKGICRREDYRGEYAKIDLTDYEKIKAYIELNRPQIIIHTAAIPDPDICETNKNSAKRMNVDVVGSLVEICNLRGIKLIHISSDYVFSGEKTLEYNLDDFCDPVNYYGKTKVAAEEIVKSCNDYLIIRVPILYGFNDENDKETFPIKVIKTLSSGRNLYVDNEQVRYPVLIDELAQVVEENLDKRGIMHVTSEKGVTKYQWAHILAKEFDLNGGLIKERNGSINKRPKHVKLSVRECGKQVSDIKVGTKVLKNQVGCVFKLIYKSAPQEVVFGYQVGSYRFSMGKRLGKIVPREILQKIDCIVPVPMSGLYYGMGVSEETGIPYVQALIKPQTNNRSFQIVDTGNREHMIREKISAIPELINNKTIALVDEAIFTGTTLKVVCDMVKACGVKGIYILIPTPMSRNRCGYYVMPNREMLAEKVRDMKLFFGVTEVFFQENETYEETIKSIPNICYECLK